MKFDLENAISRIIDSHYSASDLVSHPDFDPRKAFDFPMMDWPSTGARLHRAALNQLENGEATFSRYRNWAKDLRTLLLSTYAELDENERARSKLAATINAISAFMEIQELLDPTKGQ